MKWDGPNKGKLREALLRIYGQGSIQSLEFFVRDRDQFPDDLLYGVGGDNPEAWTGAFIEKLDERNLIPDLYKELCGTHSEHPVIEQLQCELRADPIAGEVIKVSKQDIQTLFASFSAYTDFAAVQTAFLKAFKSVHGIFHKTRPDHPPLTSLAQIQKLLEIYEPNVAVRFAENVVLELQRVDTEEVRDLSAIEDWRDRITQRYGITPIAPQPSQLEQQGYLLVALKECARKTGGNAFVTVFSELCVTGEADPVEFGAETVTCTLDEVAAHLFALIYQAETALIAYGATRVTLELFLPCEHLDLNVADWEITNRRGRPRLLGKQRSFIVRSLERAADKATQAEVKRKWQFLEGCVEKGDACDRFHPQEVPLAAGDLEDKLKDKPGLKLLAELPRDRDDYLDILDDIIDSGVPIALWFSAVEGITATEKLTEFDALLQACSCLTDFSHLANQWRTQRQNHPNQHLRMLCDCPDRWPAKPFYTDPLIAS